MTKCVCAEREASGEQGPCAACRIANFKAANSGSSEATWSTDIVNRAGVEDVL